MGILAWIVLGLIAGFIASKIVNKRGEGLIGDIILGVVGALVGGFAFRVFGYHGIQHISFGSIIVAVIGSIVVLAIYHAIAGYKP